MPLEPRLIRLVLPALLRLIAWRAVVRILAATDAYPFLARRTIERLGSPRVKQVFAALNRALHDSASFTLKDLELEFVVLHPRFLRK